ncbi:MAG: hypothetical protein AAF682_00730 [Planctomycetota bacterium]
MFRLAPGQSARYRVRPIGGGERPELTLVALRPDEGRSSQLQLELFDTHGGLVDVGRVPIDEGYLAVLKEVKQQLHSVSKWREDREFDLLLDESAACEGEAAG